MRRVIPAWPAVFFQALVLALSPAAVLAQEAAENEPPSAERQDVDEDEAEFRRRMELEDADEDAAITSPDLPDIVDVDLEPAIDDRLPPQSRTHLENQLTELIIANGRWEPEDAERPAPFEPSEAAQADPELAAREAEVWAEMVAAYHERERAALEQSTDTTAPGSAGGGNGDGQDAGAGAGGAGSGSSGAGAGAGVSSIGGDLSGTPPAGEERPAQGGAFSALEFLGEQPEEAGEGAATAPAADGERVQSAAGSTAGNAPQRSEDSGTGASGSDAPAGSLPAADLDALFQDPPASDAEDAGAPGDSSPGEPPPEPGRDDDSAESSAPPSAAEPPTPSFLDWLLGLFRSDDPPATPANEETAPEPGRDNDG